MKKSLRKELFREIRKSLNRYLSILFIVMLGVGFFTGVRASEPDMRLSMDVMADQAAFMDLRALCSYGITEGDLQALSALPDITAAEGEYSVDALERSGAKQTVLHVASLTENLNHIMLMEGRFPEKPGECLIDAQLPVVSEIRIGSVLHLESGTKDPLSDSLRHTELTVVGACTSPYYLDFERGSTAVGNGEVTGFALVDPDEFCMEVYTQAYLRSDALRALLYTSREYDEKLTEIKKAAEDVVPARVSVRMEELVGDAKRELADAKTKYSEARAEADEKFAEALQKLQDAETKLQEGEAELEKNRKKLENAAKKIEKNEAALLEAKEGLEKEEAEIAALSQSISQREQSYQAARAAWVAARTAYEAKKRAFQAKELELRVTESLPESEARMAAISRLEGELRALQEELSQAEQELQAHPQPDSSIQTQILTDRIALYVREAQLDKTREQISEGEEALTAGKEEYEEGLQALQEGEQTLREKQLEYSRGKADFEREKEDAEAELSEALLKIEDGEREIEAVKDPEWYILGRDSISSYVALDNDAARIGALGKVFPVIFFLVAALVSLATMTRMVEEKRTEIGTMLALGYSTAQVAGKYIIYALSATLTGSVFGILLGEKVLPWVIIKTYRIMYTNLQVTEIPYHLYYGILAAAAASFCTGGAALFSCMRSIKKTPAVLMRPAAPKQGKRIVLERISWLWKRLSFGQKSTLRNLFRYKKRLFMTIFGIGACMALLLVGFGLRDSIYVVTDKQFGDIWRYDGTIALSETADERNPADLCSEINETDGISAVLPVFQKQVDVSVNGTTKQGNLIVPADPETFMQMVSLRDRKTAEPRVLSSEGVIITEKLARQLSVEAGGSIRIKEDEFRSRTVTVAGITENYVYQYIYMTPDYYEKSFGTEAAYSLAYFCLRDEAQIDDVSEELLKQEAVLGVSQMGSSKDTIRDMLKNLNLIVLVLIASAGLLAAVVIYNLNNINITERVRELATLRVLGYYDGELAVYVYRENVILTLFGIAVGLFLGKWLHAFTIRTIEVDVIMFGRVINPQSYLFSVILTLGFAAAVNFIMFFRLRKIDMVESLKSIE